MKLSGAAATIQFTAILFLAGAATTFLSAQDSGNESVDGQQKTASIAPTMPVPKLPYNMPKTLFVPTAESSRDRYNSEMARSVASARQARQTKENASLAVQKPMAKVPTRQEYLKWSQPENSLRVTVKDGDGRGKPGESKPVTDLLGVSGDQVRPSAEANQVATSAPTSSTAEAGPPTASATPLSGTPAPNSAPVPAPAPPRLNVPTLGSSIPVPQLPGQSSGGQIPAPDTIISNAGGTPPGFDPTGTTGPAPDPGIQRPTVATDTASPTDGKRKRGLLGKLFGKKKDVAPAEQHISTGPNNAYGAATAPPSANPAPAVVAGEPGNTKYVFVQQEGGTQFVIAGEGVNGQSGILIPKGTVLQLIGANGPWTTVKSPNGTTGSVQTADIREATFDESIQFISSSAGQ
ncbi:MAG: hypothetical protein HKN23_09560 [Verrucomicrobiales bacterium]|nr:hypothetical protein [Verrucomicrobiales bacterium]